MGFGLKKYEIEGKTARYELPPLEGLEDAVFIVRPATEANKEYFNKVLKLTRRRKGKLKRGVDTSYLEETREEDKELFPKYIVIGWENVYDEDGTLVEFSEEECQNFIKEMPPWMFDDLRNFAGDIENFLDIMDVEARAKN